MGGDQHLNAGLPAVLPSPFCPRQVFASRLSICKKLDRVSRVSTIEQSPAAAAGATQTCYKSLSKGAHRSHSIQRRLAPAPMRATPLSLLLALLLLRRSSDSLGAESPPHPARPGESPQTRRGVHTAGTTGSHTLNCARTASASADTSGVSGTRTDPAAPGVKARAVVHCDPATEGARRAADSPRVARSTCARCAS